MIRGLRKIISLSNLRGKGARLRPRKSQIATLMILMMVAVLVLVMITVNIGQASLTAANLANAADAGALYLASQLATQAQFMWRFLDNKTQDCERVGVASVVFAVIGAIVAIVCAPAGYAIIAGAIGGAAGGAIGGEYARTGAGAGAIQGTAIGMSIGMGVSGGAGTATVELPASAAPISAEVAYPIGSALTVSTYSVAQGATGASLAAGANIYNASIGQKMTQAAYQAASKSLNSLSEYDRYRESVFLQVFLQTVDEPNEEVDKDDVDEDGKKDDKIMPFSIWWKARVDKLKATLKAITPFTEAFFQRLDDIVDKISVDKCIAWGSASGEAWDEVCTAKERCYLNLLSSSKKVYQKESIAEMVKSIRKVLGSEFCVFYPDHINYIIAELKDFSGAGNRLLTELGLYGLNAVTSAWSTWFPMLYNPDKREGFYYVLGGMLNGSGAGASRLYGLREWAAQLDEAEKKIKKEYPECEKYCPVEWEDGKKYIDYSKCFYTNSPCYLSGPKGGCSVDADLVDEIAEAKAAIQKIIDGIEGFREAINLCYVHIVNKYNNASFNPAAYSWKDSRGDLSIIVETGPFRLARIVSSKHGNILNRKVCATLQDYDDAGKCWVKVSRKIPANSKNLGILGKWNPLLDQHDLDPASREKKDFIITRTSKAYYSFDKVGLSGIKK